jgi:hypothetical protein
MRGYFSFLLVLAILLCLFAFLAPLGQLHASSQSRAIEAERANSVSMDAKGALALSTSYWMRTGASAYDSLPEAEKNPAEREAAIKAGILSGWALLHMHEFLDASDEFEVEFWCGQITRDTKAELSGEMLDSGSVLLCDGCLPLSNPACAAYVHLEQQAPYGSGAEDRVQLKGPSGAQVPAFGTFGAVGASIYSGKFGIANVVYFPTTEWIE